MKVELWGSAFSLDYRPLKDGVAFDPVTSQTPSIYVFESRPSPETIDSGSGAIGSEITSWNESTANIRVISIPAIADPKTQEKSKIYYVGLKYIAVSGGTATYDVVPFALTRPEGHTSNLTVTAAELKLYDSNLAVFYPTDSVIDNYIANAVTQITDMLDRKGFEFENILNIEKFKESLAYLTLSRMWLHKIKEDNDRFYIWAQDYKDKFEVAFSAIKFEYDKNEDDELTSDEQQEQATAVLYFTR